MCVCSLSLFSLVKSVSLNIHSRPSGLPELWNLQLVGYCDVVSDLAQGKWQVEDLSFLALLEVHGEFGDRHGEVPDLSNETVFEVLLDHLGRVEVVDELVDHDLVSKDFSEVVRFLFKNFVGTNHFHVLFIVVGSLLRAFIREQM